MVKNEQVEFPGARRWSGAVKRRDGKRGKSKRHTLNKQASVAVPHLGAEGLRGG